MKIHTFHRNPLSHLIHELEHDLDDLLHPLSYFPSFYSGETLLPQSQSPDQLSAWFSSDHQEYQQNAWCFYGRLGEPDDAQAFFIMQEYSPMLENVSTASNGRKTAISTVGYNSRSHGSYSIGGSIVPRFANDFFFRIQRSPWAISSHIDTSLEDDFPSFISVSLLSGKVGQKGAKYKLTARALTHQIGQSSKNAPLTAIVTLQDKFGAINQGLSSAGFAPQFIDEQVQEKIKLEFGGDVQRYLADTQNSKALHGLYSYSLPMLDVLDYRIVGESGKELAQGNSGNIWCDIMIGSPNSGAQKATPTWLFYAIPIFESLETDFNGAITTTMITAPNQADQLESFAWSNLVSDSRAPSKWPNGSYRSSAARLGDVNINVLDHWIAPNTHYKFPKTVLLDIQFDHPEVRTAALTCTPMWDNQVVTIDLPILGKVSKYEGLVRVTGSLIKSDGSTIPVDTVGWCENSNSHNKVN